MLLYNFKIMSKYYDTLGPEDQQEIKDFLTKHKNSEKDPDYTREFIRLTLNHFVVFTPQNEYRQLTSHTKENEHKEIRKALKQTDAKQTLEVGFAFGTSALVFAEHHQRMKNTGISHTIIDPNQYGKGEGAWEGIGAENLKRVGFIKNRNWRLVEASSIEALPALYKKFGSGWLDVALVDGWHLFDYTLLDVMYCLQMLRVGGILIVDDKRMKAIHAVAKYVTRAYPHVVDICTSCKTMLVLRKKSEDTRDWNTDEKVNFNLA
jgi:predicted O-methyltransferase YrrM